VQTVSAAFTAAETANYAGIQVGAQVAWSETINGTYNFFTIGTSTIGGPDFIPASMAAPTLFDKYQYTDESNYVLGYSITRSIGQYPYGVICANATLTLDNTSLRFAPGYDGTIGSYVALSGRPIKVSTGFVGAETIQLFVGFGTGAQQSLADRSMTQNAYDGMNYLATYKSTTTPDQVNQTWDQIVIALLQEAGFSSSQYVVEASTQAAIGYFSPYGQLIGDILTMGCEAEQGIAFFDENGVFHFWNRNHIANISSPSWTFNYNSIVDWQTETTPVINDVLITANPRTVQALQLVWQMSSPVQVPAGGTYTVEADFSDASGPLPVTSVDTPTYSATSTTDSYYSTNINSDGSGPAASSSISVSSHTLNGASYLVTFSNSGVQPVYVTALSLYGTPAKVTAAISQEYSSSTSILANGKNPANNGLLLEIDNDLIQSTSTAQSNAYILVNDYATPNVRITAQVFEVPQLQIGDLVTVTFDDSGSTQTYTIVGITLTWDPDSFITMNLELERKTLLKYFQINVSTIGGTDHISPG
jgi:hypothetical protein